MSGGKWFSSGNSEKIDLENKHPGVSGLIPAGALNMPKDLEAVQDTGFEVKWDGPVDTKNPLNWSFWRKAVILLVIALQSLTVYGSFYLPLFCPIRRW